MTIPCDLLVHTSGSGSAKTLSSIQRRQGRVWISGQQGQQANPESNRAVLNGPKSMFKSVKKSWAETVWHWMLLYQLDNEQNEFWKQQNYVFKNFYQILLSLPLWACLLAGMAVHWPPAITMDSFCAPRKLSLTSQIPWIPASPAVLLTLRAC